MDVLWACRKCSTTTHPYIGRISEYELHNNSFHSNDTERCNKCPNRFSSATERLLHEKEDHVKDLCLQCAVSPGIENFFLEDEFAKHYRDFHEKATYRCEGCPNRFLLEATRKVHKYQWHGIGADSPSITCLGCESYNEFPNKKAMDSHNSQVHRSRKHVCKNCHNTFKRISQRDEHAGTCHVKYS